MFVSDFNYELPEELIAQTPVPGRSGSRMLAMDRQTGERVIRPFTSFPDFLNSRDCLVLNDTRVIPARLFGRRSGSGGKVEALLLEEIEEGCWQAMLRPARRLKPGAVVEVGDGETSFRVVTRSEDGTAVIRFDADDVLGLLDRFGHMPLPPYIQRDDEAADRERYQTVYAERAGAVAAPTAGLHFTPEILTDLEAKGVAIVHVTLHVGIGTFRPVKVDRIDKHEMHFERYELSPEAARSINAARRGGGRIVAVGTTSVRTLETVANDDGTVRAGSGRTNIFLHPPKQPKVVDALLTNFHLPKSTLLMLVSCFADREHVMAAYQHAIREKLRFFSYGDCMFLHQINPVKILPCPDLS